MNIEVREKRVLSSDGVHTLVGRVYIPDVAPRAIFHVVHGMTEYIGRYDSFMREMAARGYVVFGYDHLGHGETAGDGELGYFAGRDGYDLLALDVKIFSDEMKAAYPTLPYYLMGHSMGSFVVRLATERYVRPDKLVIMGTGGPNGAAGIGLAFLKIIRAFKGEKHISETANSLAFGSYNKRYKSERDPNSWLTKDESVRKRFALDPKCNFRFTVSAMIDLVTLNKLTNREAWFKNMPFIPILLVSGEGDPVGDYGKGVKKVYKKLTKYGKNAELILYPTGRHEILNDDTKGKVTADIAAFLAR